MAGVNAAMLQHDEVLAAISGTSSSDLSGPPPAVIGGSLAYDMVDQLAQQIRSRVNDFVFAFHRAVRPAQLCR